MLFGVQYSDWQGTRHRRYSRPTAWRRRATLGKASAVKVMRLSDRRGGCRSAPKAGEVQSGRASGSATEAAGGLDGFAELRICGEPAPGFRRDAAPLPDQGRNVTGATGRTPVLLRRPDRQD